MKTFQRISPAYFFADVIGIVLSFFVPYVFRYNKQWGDFHALNFPYLAEHLFIVGLWTFLIVTGFRRHKLYETDRQILIPQEIFHVCLRIFYASSLISAVIFYSQYKFFSRLVFIQTFFAICVTLTGWRVIKRLVLRQLIRKGFHNINVLIVGAGKVGHLMAEEIQANPYWGFNVVGFLDDYKTESAQAIPIVGTTSDLVEVCRRHFVDEIIITIPAQANIVRRHIREARGLRLGIRIIPENFSDSVSALSITHMGIIPLLTYKERRRHPSEFALKRFLDIVISLGVLVVFFPVFFLIAILIKRDSSGPIFYIQKRVGLKGRAFYLYKFRSMVKDADEMRGELEKNNEVLDGVIFKMKADPRTTRIGRFLRKYSLDEFPQFWNVLKGDMSLVGPRPPTVDEVAQYSNEQMIRLSIRPGLTCISQVKGRSDLTFREWVKLDLWYIQNWSFGLDMQILWWTIPVVIKGNGAY